MAQVEYRLLDFMGYPAYRVGDDGSVWRWFRTKGWKQLSPVTMSKTHDYLVVRLSKDGVARPFSVHRLVLFAFVGPCPPGMEARHFPDRTPTNNRRTNLSWASPLVNNRDKWAHGTMSQGRRHAKSLEGRKGKLAVIEVRAIKKSKENNGVLARRFNVSSETVRSIRLGRTWRWL